MAKKKKGVDRKVQKENNYKEQNIKLSEKKCFQSIVQSLKWVFQLLIIIISLTMATLTVLGVYYVVSNSTMSAQLPELDMDKYWGSDDSMNPKQDASIRPYKIDFSDVVVNDLKERLLYQKPYQPPLVDSDANNGFDHYCFRKLLDFWKSKYNFKEKEDFFNKYDHYVTNIQGLDMHYLHVQPTVSSDVKVVTLLLLHSWPGSILEFYDVIPKLSTPNPKYKFVFEIIAPSLPGFGFSQAPARPGMDPLKMAIIISKLMERIGRTTYYVHGGDIGHSVGSALATVFPSNVLGLHTTTPKIEHPMTIFRAVLGSLIPGLTFDSEIPTRTFSLHTLLWRAFVETGYERLQVTKSDAIGIALTDSPAGLAAYIFEKFSVLTNPEYRGVEDGSFGDKCPWTQLLDNVMVYWVSNSITTSLRVHTEYCERNYFNLDFVETKVPTWGLSSKDYQGVTPLSVLKMKYKNYLHTTEVEHGGGFVAMKHPGVLVNDIFAAVDAFMDCHAKINKPRVAAPITLKPKTIYDFSVTDIYGREVQLSKYKGYVLLIVNVASQCGLTDKNYEQLKELYEEYEGKGLRILAFPCNQFGFQEPGTPLDIIDFTRAKGVRFDVFSKIDVNGDGAHPLWQFLKRSQSGTFGGWIKWNFSKFIVDRDGVPVERFGPDVNPAELKPFIAKYINYTGRVKHEDL